MGKDDPRWAEWAEALERERKNGRARVEMQVAMAIEREPTAFGLSKAEAKRMGQEGRRRMANAIAAALGQHTGLVMIERPSLRDKQFDPYFWWKHTWNAFRALGHKSSMIFSRDLYVALTLWPYHQFTDMDANVDMDPDDRPPTTGFGLRVVK